MAEEASCAPDAPVVVEEEEASAEAEAVDPSSSYILPVVESYLTFCGLTILAVVESCGKSAEAPMSLEDIWAEDEYSCAFLPTAVEEAAEEVVLAAYRQETAEESGTELMLPPLPVLLLLPLLAPPASPSPLAPSLLLLLPPPPPLLL